MEVVVGNKEYVSMRDPLTGKLAITVSDKDSDEYDFIFFEVLKKDGTVETINTRNVRKILQKIKQGKIRIVSWNITPGLGTVGTEYYLQEL